MTPAAPQVAPLLRAPPFPGLDPGETPGRAAEPPVGAARTALFAMVRKARIGGTYWAGPPEIERPVDCAMRPASPAEEQDLRSQLLGKSVAAFAQSVQIDPWRVLTLADELIAHGKDEWIALARIAGLKVRVLSPGPYGSPDDNAEELDRKAAQALCQLFHDPFTGSWLRPEDAIPLLAEWRRMIDGNRGGPGETIVAACGISWWKREEIKRFLFVPGETLGIYRSSKKALSVARTKNGALAVWPSRISPQLLAQAEELGVPIVRVEDGFVRSAGLGSNLVPPSSVIVDRQGIHFDPAQPSDLETILATTDFTPDLLERAGNLAQTIREAGISKYASGQAGQARKLRRDNGKRVVLVPGQVEDDMSVRAGGGGLASNLELLRRTRSLEPEAEIWWRPHPDVEAGHRVGAVDDHAALQYADRIMREPAMADLLAAADGVHTLTSLTGFEALMRGLDVTCHGTPFYAGWGLTRDLGEVPDRRGRQLSVDELVAGVLLLYPRYLDPVTGLPSPPEVLIKRMAQAQMPNRQGWVEPVRRAQGWIMAHLRRRSA